MVPSDRTRGQGAVDTNWNRLSREVVGSHSLEIFRTWLGMILCNLLQVYQL